jgi:hypothetical protein
VFNEQGEAQQLNLFPSHVEVPDDHPQVARVEVDCRQSEQREARHRLPHRSGRLWSLKESPHATLVLVHHFAEAAQKPHFYPGCE